jgi:hypothetical protein
MKGRLFRLRLIFFYAGFFVRAEPYIVGDEECAVNVITIPFCLAISKKDAILH